MKDGREVAMDGGGLASDLLGDDLVDALGELPDPGQLQLENLVLHLEIEGQDRTAKDRRGQGMA